MTRIAIVSTVKAPLHELRMFVNYHLNIGINEIVLFFDDPHDPALSAFSGYKNVSTIACTNEYWLKKLGHNPGSFADKQITNVNEGVLIAVKKECDWIIHIDSDELIKPSANIGHILANCGADALRFNMMEAVSEKKGCDNIFATTLFKKPSSGRKLQLVKLLGCSKALFENEYFRGHTASKMALRVSPKIRVYGVHGPKEYDKNTTFMENTNAIKLLHFDCVGFKSWDMKWSRRLNGPCNFQTMRPNRVKQLQAYGQATKHGRGNQVRLYKRLHVISGYQKVVLFFLGMLKKVKLDQELFESP